MNKRPTALGDGLVMPSTGFQNRSAMGILVTAATLILAALAAGAIGFYGPFAGLGLALLLVVGGLMLFPRASVWAVATGGLVVVGLVELYLPSLQNIRWAFAVWSVFLAIVSAVHWFGHRSPGAAWSKGTYGLSIAMGIFLLAFLLASIAGGVGIGGAVVGFKNYFQMWGLTLALAWLGYRPIDARRFVVFLSGVALIQLPFVLHQYIVLVPLRSWPADAARSIVAVDIVAGTFGGNMQGGGRSSNLATLIAIAITYFLAQWKLGLRSVRSTFALSAFAFIPILLNEAKLVFILLPVTMLVVFRKNLVQRPLHALLGAALTVCLLALVVVVYSSLPGAETQKSKSVSGFIESSLSYNIGNKGYGNAVLNRNSVYSFWFNEHIKSGAVLPALGGHGPGFSNATSIGKGDNPASARFRGYAIGLTGFSSLLWDTGVLGTLSFVFVLAMAFRLATKLAVQWQGTVHEPCLETAKVAVVLLGLNLLHNDFVTFDIGFQTMFALVLGYLFAMARPQGIGAQ